MTFAERHARVDANHIDELRRRTELWASCPSSDGNALEPAAQIVPRQTINGVLDEVWTLRMRLFWTTVAAAGFLLAAFLLLVSK